MFNKNFRDVDYWNTIILDNPSLFYKVPKKFHNEFLCLKAVSFNGLYLKYITNQTEELCVKAVSMDGMALQYVKRQTPEICLAAVRKNGLALKYSKIKSDEVCLAAINDNPYSIKYIKKQTDKLCWAAIKKMPESIMFIKNKTHEQQVVAVSSNGFLIKYIDKTSEEIESLAIKSYSKSIAFIKKPAEKIQMLAIENFPLNLRYIKNPSFNVCAVAVASSYWAFDEVPEKMRTLKLNEIAARSFLIGVKGGYTIGSKYIESLFLEKMKFRNDLIVSYLLMSGVDRSVVFNKSSTNKIIDKFKRMFNGKSNDVLFEYLKNNKSNINKDADNIDVLCDALYSLGLDFTKNLIDNDAGLFLDNEKIRSVYEKMRLESCTEIGSEVNCGRTKRLF